MSQKKTFRCDALPATTHLGTIEVSYGEETKSDRDIIKSIGLTREAKTQDMCCSLYEFILDFSIGHLIVHLLF